MSKPQLIVALDVDTFEKARELIDSLSPVVDFFKVGSQLFTACGPAAVRFILAREKKVFLDLKYHDIPNTVANAVKAAVSLGVPISAGENLKTSKDQRGISMLTLHTMGGRAMLKAAVEASRQRAQELNLKKPFLVGITVLTSEEKGGNTSQLVLERARLAQEAGLDGVVISPNEIKTLRREFGEDFIIVTPGIRPAGSLKDDQKRTGTPQEAVQNGSNFLVVGRPVIEAPDSLGAAKNILEEINAAQGR